MKRETICLIIACLISFILTAGIMNWRMEIVHAELSDTQQSLAKEVFRFHVIAESDSANDQKSAGCGSKVYESTYDQSRKKGCKGDKSMDPDPQKRTDGYSR